ncbi:MAG TPA: tetratricopeptide repeat protein, partial [Thermoguttaceae bacterium]|nr:tetratricopeptide repeat protein [Thermoguttaceae bacterium]
ASAAVVVCDDDIDFGCGSWEQLIPTAAHATAAEATRIEAENLVALGNIEYRQLRFSEALAKYDESIAKVGTCAVAHNNRALALHKLGRLDEANVALKKAVELDAGRAAFHLNLAKVHATASRYEDALQSIDEALRIEPNMPAAVYNRVWILDERGENAKAAEARGRLAALKEPPPGSKLLAAIVEARQGRADPLAEALFAPDDLPQAWRWLLDANRSLVTGGAADLPPDARTALVKGLRAASREQAGAAQRHFADAAAVEPKHPLPNWLSAMVLITSGDQSGAITAMQRAGRKMPTFSVPAGDEPAVVIIDGALFGLAPAKTSLLPGVHLVDVIRRDGKDYSIFNKCGVFRPSAAYKLPKVEFKPMRPPSELKLPGGLGNTIQDRLTTPQK